MPFSWFGGATSTNSTSATTESASGGSRPQHARKVSLSSSLSSSSGGQSARLADVRAKAKTSYFRKYGMAQLSGDLSTSRGSRSVTNNNLTRKQIIVAIEPDTDNSTRGRRIDQGLLDACKEAQDQVLPLEPLSSNKSWWSSYYAPSSTASPSLSDTACLNNANSSIAYPANHDTEVKANPTTETGHHRRTVSYNKTYRVP